MLWSWKKIGPRTGRLDRSGIENAGSRAVSPAFDRPSPSTRASPVPRNVSARPDTTWSARRWIVTIAWTRLISPPASIAVARPSQALPVETAVEKPATAPISIIPSTPRFRTPDRSAKISPTAANSSTVPVAMPAARMSVQVHSVTGRRPARRPLTMRTR